MNSYSNSDASDSKMSLNSFKGFLICPVCKNKLDNGINTLLCSDCGTNFPQIDNEWVNLFPASLLQEEEQWASRLQDMESWYQNLIASPAKASSCLLSDYTPFATTLNSLSGKVLDIGGGGGLVRHYLSPDTEYIVLDPSLDWLGVEWENLSDVFPCLAERPAFIRGVGEYVPFPDNHFDVVLSFWSANHSNSPRKLFEEVERVLRPGGKFIIVLEDMIPLWQDIFDRHFPSNQVFQSFFDSEENSSKFTRLRLLFRILLGREFPLQSDHVRIQEYDIHQWIKNRFDVVQRTWSNQFLTFELRKNNVYSSNREALNLEVIQENNLQQSSDPSHLASDKVSIIIPCYKQAHYLGEAITSVLTQSYRNFEIIVVDDGSPDNTAEVAACYPVRYISQENQGLSGARNTGWLASEGKYLVFLDADDRLTPDALQVGLKCLKAHSECAFISGHHRYINGDGSLLKEYPPEPIDDDHYIALLKRNYIGMHATVMYQRFVFDVLGGFDTSLKSCEDHDLYLRIAKEFPVYRHHYITAEYRWHDSNMTHNSSRMLNAALAVLRSQWRHVQNNPQYIGAFCSGLNFARNYFGQQLLGRTVKALKAGQLGDAVANLSALFKYFPLWLSALSLELRALVWFLLYKMNLWTICPDRSSDLNAGANKQETSLRLANTSTPKVFNSHES